jgi:aspartate beta-hydroxylase
MATDDIRQLLQAGADALDAGDAPRARELYSRCTDLDASSAAGWFGRAQASVVLGEEVAALEATEAVLAIEPRNCRALIMKADYLAGRGDERAAAAFYAAAVKHAPPSALLDPITLQDVTRARDMCNMLAERFQAHLYECLRTAGFSPENSSRRFVKSLDMLNGRARATHLQRPRFYFLPDLPPKQFYEREEFAWAPELEAATSAIRDELANVFGMSDAFAPYVQRGSVRPVINDRGLLNNKGWSACYIIKNGEVVPDIARMCPATINALKDVPLDCVPGRTPSVLFSLLRPGMRIPPHHGFVNTRLIGHLPLITPPNCRLRVGSEVRPWVEGELLLFDDTVEHEAWNDSEQLRVVLLFDFWRPELSSEERALVSALFQAIDSYGGRSPEWN